MFVNPKLNSRVWLAASSTHSALLGIVKAHEQTHERRLAAATAGVGMDMLRVCVQIECMLFQTKLSLKSMHRLPKVHLFPGCVCRCVDELFGVCTRRQTCGRPKHTRCEEGSAGPRLWGGSGVGGKVTVG